LLKSSHSQIALATGLSILLIASSSAWILEKSINPFLLAVPPLIEAAYEGLLKKNKESKFLKTWYWVCGIIFSTILIIFIHMM
jgi:4-amino-4-deoxy-L-arabinose transferase-like glycosyltransferase